MKFPYFASITMLAFSMFNFAGQPAKTINEIIPISNSDVILTKIENDEYAALYRTNKETVEAGDYKVINGVSAKKLENTSDTAPAEVEDDTTVDCVVVEESTSITSQAYSSTFSNSTDSGLVGTSSETDNANNEVSQSAPQDNSDSNASNPPASSVPDTEVNPKPEIVYHNGWFKENGKWFFYKDNSPAPGWLYWNGSWYFIKNNGEMLTKWVAWKRSWYYMNPSGIMATGWVKDGNTWYYLNGSGVMQTGWIKLGSTWYYLNGSDAMAEGWKNVGGIWYWLTPGNGGMRTGCIHDGSNWYWMNGSGAMQRNHWIGNYWVGSSGAMATTSWVDNNR